MTERRQNELIASLYRQMFYSKMIEIECAFFMSFKFESGIRQVLIRMKNCYHNSLLQLKTYMPKSNAEFQKHIDISDEKVRDMARIINKLSMLEEADVARLADDFDSMITVNY